MEPAPLSEWVSETRLSSAAAVSGAPELPITHSTPHWGIQQQKEVCHQLLLQKNVFPNTKGKIQNLRIVSLSIQLEYESQCSQATELESALELFNELQLKQSYSHNRGI